MKLSIKVPIKWDKEAEYLFDKLMEGDTLYLDDGMSSRKLGRYGKPLRSKKKERSILHISTDDLTDERIAFLRMEKLKSHEKQKTSKGIWYIFEL